VHVGGGAIRKAYNDCTDRERVKREDIVRADGVIAGSPPQCGMTPIIDTRPFGVCTQIP